MNSAAILLYMGFVLGSGIPHGDDDALLTKPEIAKQLADQDETWRKMRARLTLNDNSVVSNCDQYAKKRVGVSEELMPRLASSEYLICDVITLLRNSIRVITLPLTGVGKELHTHLDIRSLPTSLSQLADEKTFILSSITDIPARVTDNSIISDTEDWFFKLEVIAVADIDKDKKQDWIIWMTDEAKDGNYRAYKTLIIYDPPSDSAWRAVEYRN